MPSDAQWIIGFLIAGAVVVVVVLLVGTILYLASQIKGQVHAIHAALQEAEDNTAALWKAQEMSQATLDLVSSAMQARQAMAGSEDR